MILDIREITNEHIRLLLTKIEDSGDMTYKTRGHVMRAMHELAADIKVEVEIYRDWRHSQSSSFSKEADNDGK